MARPDGAASAEQNSLWLCRVVTEEDEVKTSELIRTVKQTTTTEGNHQHMKGDKKQQQYRVNEQIRVREVRIVGDGIEPKVVPTRDALRLAEQMEVDLVEISPIAQPPICCLID